MRLGRARDGHIDRCHVVVLTPQRRGIVKVYRFLYTDTSPGPTHLHWRHTFFPRIDYNVFGTHLVGRRQRTMPKHTSPRLGIGSHELDARGGPVPPSPRSTHNPDSGLQRFRLAPFRKCSMSDNCDEKPPPVSREARTRRNWWHEANDFGISNSPMCDMGDNPKLHISRDNTKLHISQHINAGVVFIGNQPTPSASCVEPEGVQGLSNDHRRCMY